MTYGIIINAEGTEASIQNLDVLTAGGLIYHRSTFRAVTCAEWFNSYEERFALVSKFIERDAEAWNVMCVKCDEMNLTEENHRRIAEAAMPVADLIAELQKLPADAKVVIRAFGEHADVVGDFVKPIEFTPGIYIIAESE
jgi:hypothetical protein